MSYYETVTGDLEAFNVVGGQVIIPTSSPITSYTWSDLDPLRTYKLKYQIRMNTGTSLQNIHLNFNGDTGSNYKTNVGSETAVNLAYSYNVGPTCLFSGQVLIYPGLIGQLEWDGVGTRNEGPPYIGRTDNVGYYEGAAPLSTLLIGSTGSKTFYGKLKLLMEAETI